MFICVEMSVVGTVVCKSENRKKTSEEEKEAAALVQLSSAQLNSIDIQFSLLLLFKTVLARNFRLRWRVWGTE